MLREIRVERTDGQCRTRQKLFKCLVERCIMMRSEEKTMVVVVGLLLMLVNVSAYANYAVDSYWADPPTLDCAAAFWACDPDNTKLTDGVFATTEGYLDGLHAAWEMPTGTGPSIYFDLGSVQDVGAVGLNYLSWYSSNEGDLTVLTTEDSDPNTAIWTTVNYNDEWAPRVQWTNPTLELGIFQNARLVRLDFICIDPGYSVSYVMLAEVYLSEPNAIVILTQPEGVVVDAGETVTLTVDAQTGSAYTLNYQWLKDGVALTNGGDISGADSDTLQIADVDASDVADYNCHVTSNGDSTGVETESATVLVVSLTEYGTRVTSHLPLLYWNFDEAAGPAGDLVSKLSERNISAENPARVTHGDFGQAIEISEGDDTTTWRSGSLGVGDYTGPFVVELMIRKHTVQKNPPATDHNAYIMEVGGNNAPAIIDGFRLSGQLNEIAVFNASRGTAGYGYIEDTDWHHVVFADYDDNKIDMYVDGVKVTDFGYVYAADAGAYLNLNGPTAVGGTMYWGGAYWGYDIDEIAYYDLTGLTEAEIATRGQAISLHSDVDGPVYITEDPRNTVAPPGTDAVLTVAAAGAGPFSYQWKKDGVDLTDGGNVSGATTPILTLTNVQPGVDNGQYSCSVSNSLNSVDSAAGTLFVQCYYDIPGDVNNDCIVDVLDFAELAAHWLEESDVQ